MRTHGNRPEGYDVDAYKAAWVEVLGDMSQRQLAFEVGVDPSYLNGWVRGRVPDRKWLIRAAELRRVDPNVLLVPAGLEPERPDPDRLFMDGIVRLSEELGRDILVSTQDAKLARSSPEEVEKILEAIRQRALAEAAGEGG